MLRLSKNGDTIIEVVLSMALLTSILFISWGITNRATQITLAAKDRTEMVNQVKEQAEIIKAQWANPTSRNVLFTYNPAGALNPDACNGSIVSGSFVPTGGSAWYLTADNNAIDKVDSVKQIGDRPFYVYVQRKDGSLAGATYSDFYVRACWDNSSGSVQTKESSQVIVRLNQ